MSGSMVKLSPAHIATYIKNAKEKGKPYVIFTGAGCSLSAGIPLAGKLIEEIKQKYPTQAMTAINIGSNDYGQYMACLTKDERRELIRAYVDGAKINWAHIVLANLMKEGFVNRVLTFNFDNILGS
ncbi:NAD-dependent protein deacetylase [Ephemeroptericola cinctiostellae]|uniref:NAD-dependent protein deacetylase n=1 Tax=Ephemeroptericola cinctiostellae TaxID=2268024 RepID=A0A345DD89_9BURK|nr:hypothetical protein [Ephemeroptericola cinctiostellae]AXF86327.1 NAD-dependent protein deacetylase [Ephemeroptericola cinctiostellae]